MICEKEQSRKRDVQEERRARRETCKKRGSREAAKAATRLDPRTSFGRNYPTTLTTTPVGSCRRASCSLGLLGGARHRGLGGLDSLNGLCFEGTSSYRRGTSLNVPASATISILNLRRQFTAIAVCTDVFVTYLLTCRPDTHSQYSPSPLSLPARLSAGMTFAAHQWQPYYERWHSTLATS
jgi:hypothetical protein